MRGLDPRIHQSSERILAKMMDCRGKPGNDKQQYPKANRRPREAADRPFD
jgi:hypothetical protein